MPILMMTDNTADDADGDVDEADDAIVFGVDVAVNVIVTIALEFRRSQ